MADYKTLYLKSFNALTDADRLIQQASAIIRTAQRECEDLYIESDDAPIFLDTTKKSQLRGGLFHHPAGYTSGSDG